MLHTPAVRCVLLDVQPHRVLIGACDPILRVRIRGRFVMADVLPEIMRTLGIAKTPQEMHTLTMQMGGDLILLSYSNFGFGIFLAPFQALYHPTRAVWCTLRRVHAHWMLIGA